VSSVDQTEARRGLGIPADAFVLLVLGGSQGAAAVNRVVWEVLPLLPARVFVLHQTGPQAGSPRVADRDGYASRPCLDATTLPLAFRAANLVLNRCGASTLAEIAANGLPSVLVPYPAAYADHQTANARAVSEAGAGVLLPQAELTAEALSEQVQGLMGDSERLGRMASASASLARPDAAAQVARAVLECAEA
jgi:UDP-N-acetylglucosamine--N-acetylmuramyl-(pentapeptide) pyrophosphoryl-undecaprenol N-acetylglucosamine transferase